MWRSFGLEAANDVSLGGYGASPKNVCGKIELMDTSFTLLHRKHGLANHELR